MDTQDQILQNLMMDLGLENLPQDKQEELVMKMTEVVLKRMFVETMDRLDQTDQDTYSEMLDRGAIPEEIEQFLRSKIENYDQLLEKIVTDFKKEMTGSASEGNQ
jgi:hypothetical protein